jgi:acyl-CoA synthetase (AMP-forming)/AMP-acid ligase II
VIVPLTEAVRHHRDEFLEVAQCDVSVSLDAHDQITVSQLPGKPTHEIYQTLCERGSPGLVLFSSGSTGKAKAAVHDLVPLLKKFEVRRHKLRAISFLLYDHIGGVNTMLYTLSNGGCMVTVPNRLPDTVLEAVARWDVELLPTSPTFTNLLLVSEALDRHEIPTLRLLTYGTEPMPEATLKAVAEAMPNVRLQQTYGLSELGILRSQSRANDSLWMRLGGEGFELRIVDNMLQIKAESAMLGYLNAPSPFTEDGWFKTGDVVEVDGEWMRILGRDSDLINVGGEKVYPAEVEGVIQRMDNVLDVIVYGGPNVLTGKMVAARVTLKAPEDHRAFTRRLKKHCRAHLAKFKVPVRVVFSDEQAHNERFKKMRNFG